MNKKVILPAMIWLSFMFLFSCTENPIWEIIPKDGTWEGPSVGLYPDRKIKFIVEDSGTKIKYFAIYPGSIGEGRSISTGWDIEDSSFEIKYSDYPPPGMSSLRGTVTGKFTSHTKAIGEYSLRVFPGNANRLYKGEWTAEWISNSTEYL